MTTPRLNLEGCFDRDEVPIITQALGRLTSKQDGGGGAHVILVGGVGGSGKTTLVRNALSSGDGLKTRDYWCVSAKFDKVTSSPFSVIRTFLLGLSSQIQTDSAVERCEQLVYEHFQDAAHQWNVLITFAPDIEELFPNGPKEKAIKRDHETSLVSSKNDFNLLKLAIRSFLCVLSIQKPLVLVLDDIMWSDTETFEVLKFILTTKEVKSILVCATYRNDEVDETHPLSGWKEAIKKSLHKGHFREITLVDLSVLEVTRMVAAGTRREEDEISDLAEFLHERTHGNLFYLSSLVQQIQEMKLLVYDPVAHQFKWKLSELERRVAVSENVAELVCSRLEMLDPDVQNVLKLAALFGTFIHTQVLATTKTVFDLFESPLAFLK